MNKNKILSNAFMWVFIGLLICFATSYVTTLSEEMFLAVYGMFNGYGYFIYAILEIVLAIILSVRIRKLSPITAKILYLLYTFLTGLSLSGIMLVYTGSSIAFVFLVTAIIFGAFAIIGKTTKVDMSKWYTYLFVGLLSIILLEIINIFLMNNTLDIILCIVCIVIFCAYTAYDVQRALDDNYLADTANKGIFVAFQLFLDFINIFLRLLRLLGRERD